MAQKKKQLITKGLVAINRRANFDYAIEDKLEAGIVLTGSEVKSLRLGLANITEGYIRPKGSELFVYNVYIPLPQTKNHFSHEERRPRKLLLHEKEIKKILGAFTREGATIVPMSLYFNNRGTAKFSIGIGKGKKKHDKRESEKEKSWKKAQGRLMREKG